MLVESGYALAKLPLNRIMLVFNLEHGELKGLPFDLGQTRVATYQLGEGDKLAASRKALAENFSATLRSVLDPPEFKLSPVAIAPTTTTVDTFAPVNGSRDPQPFDSRGCRGWAHWAWDAVGRVLAALSFAQMKGGYGAALGDTLSTEIAVGRSGEVEVRAFHSGAGVTIR